MAANPLDVNLDVSDEKCMICLDFFNYKMDMIC